MNNQRQQIMTVEEAMEAIRFDRVRRARDIPRRVFKDLIKLNLVYSVQNSTDPVILTGKGMARLRQMRESEYRIGRKARQQESRNG